MLASEHSPLERRGSLQGLDRRLRSPTPDLDDPEAAGRDRDLELVRGIHLAEEREGLAKQHLGLVVPIITFDDGGERGQVGREIGPVLVRKRTANVDPGARERLG